ncbi:cupin domain-containing protein [Candidatus Thorarchaeota archaeon]|nr:MAG: cupin domain-containing protein [Candidatus Thorarchaeota archaeon]
MTVTPSHSNCGEGEAQSNTGNRLLVMAMVKVYRAKDADAESKEGYSARYVADLLFKKATGSAGIILVDVDAGKQTQPHAHAHLEEIFIPLSSAVIEVDDKRIELEEGDVVIVEAGRHHCFQAQENQPLRIIAIKIPNLKNDKVEQTHYSSNQ